jgi:hypothetical protein
MFDFSEPVGFTIFCDDIREEMGGKGSLIGIYESVMLIHLPLPTALPKFGFHIEILEPAKLALERDFPIEINIHLPGDEDDKPSYFGTVPADPEGARAELDNLPWQPTGTRPLLAHRTFNFIVAPIRLKEPGAIRVTAKYKEDVLRCGSLQVIQGEIRSPS